MSGNQYDSGHRGSRSAHASGYKTQGHADEEEFALLMGANVIPGQQKADVVEPNGTTYSCKGGGKHWQILLYRESNFRDKEWGGSGVLFMECINCFPSDIDGYFRDKTEAKRVIYKYLRDRSGEEVYNHSDAVRLPKKIRTDLKNSLRNNHSRYRDLMGCSNSYLNSKLKLQIVTKKMKEKFEEKGQVRKFLKKGIFANDEVDKLVVKEGDNFLVFNKSDVLDILEENLTVANSDAGHGIDDILIAGQKTIMKYRTNIVELEIRNDPKHYREVRFNMKRQKAMDLFKRKTKEVDSSYGRVKHYKKL